MTLTLPWLTPAVNKMIARRLKYLAAAALVLREESNTWVVVQFRQNL